MAYIKKCPACNRKNDPSEMLCVRCLGDISGIEPIEELENDITVEEEAYKDPTEQVDHFLMLKVDNQDEIQVPSNTVLGRDGVWADQFEKHPTISREHARFTYIDDKWYVEDLGSTNGTYHNGIKLEKGKKAEVHSGDKISFSKTCRTIVLF